MIKKKHNVSFLTVIWNRLKWALGKTEGNAKLAYKIQFLERCFIEDCLVEKTRKRLERQWQEVAN